MDIKPNWKNKSWNRAFVRPILANTTVSSTLLLVIKSCQAVFVFLLYRQTKYHVIKIWKRINDGRINKYCLIGFSMSPWANIVGKLKILNIIIPISNALLPLKYHQQNIPYINSTAKFKNGKSIIPKPQTGVSENGERRISFWWNTMSIITCDKTPI